MTKKLSIIDKDIDTILVLDFGSQYTQLIARRIRELGVYSEILPWDISSERLKCVKPKGVILSGGPESVTKTNTPRISNEIFALSVPILGICYGMQTLAEQNDGKVTTSSKKEFGYSKFSIEQDSLLFKGINTKQIEVWMSHGDKVSSLPNNFELTGSTESAQIASMEHKELPYYALQFHPEVSHTNFGLEILGNFVSLICKCKKDWNIGDLIEQRVNEIKEQVGNEKVLLGLSGGVDSSVTAMLLNKAIGSNLTCMFIDNGLLRKNEVEEVISLFKENIKLNLEVVDAKKTFYRHLNGVKDPEQKRKIIGRTFIDIFDNESVNMKTKEEIKFLAQGTIYPDVIESSESESNEARIIKSHHNVGGLPDEMKMELVEPLRDLFKDEVRKLGAKLDLPSDILNRHPFPGPGLGIRIIGEVNEDRLNKLREADHIFLSELKKQNLYYTASQAYAFYLPVKSVGVVGDNRIYADVIGLRSVDTTDFMTAKASALPHDFIEHVSTRIVNEINGISRVVYDITSKPPATIEWE